MMKRLISMLCMILIITLPLASAQFEAPYERQEARGYASSAIFGGEQQDVGEWIIINVDDYEPKLVRQSHLEQESVPVFISLRGETFGTLASRATGEDTSQRDPLTGVSYFPPIRNMYVTMNGSSDFVSGRPHYIAPRREDYSLGSMGYLLVNLKRLDKRGLDLLKNNTDSVITLDMDAEIDFDFEKGNLFGITSQDLFLKLEKDTTHFLNKLQREQNPFFSARGFMNLVDIDDNTATLVIYDRHYGTIFPTLQTYLPSTLGRVLPGSGALDRNTGIRLTVGETSPVLSLGDTNDPFKDLFRVRLNEIVSADDRAVLEMTINGVTNTRIVNRGKGLYYGSNWRVSSVEIANILTISLDKAKEDFQLDDETYSRLSDVGDDLSVVEHRVWLKNSNGENKRLVRKILKVGAENAKVAVLDLTPDQVVALEQRYCPELESTTEPNYGCRALRLYQRYLSDAGEDYQALQQIVEIYEKDLITYPGCMPSDIPLPTDPKCIAYKKDMVDLASYYQKRLKATGYFDPLKEEEKIISIGGETYLNDEGVHLKLKEVELLDQNNKGSVFLRVNNGQRVELHLNDIVPLDTAYLAKQDYFIEDGVKYNWRVYKIGSKNVVLRKYKAESAEFDPKNYVSRSRSFVIDDENVLDYKIEEKGTLGGESVSLQVSILVDEINVKNEAYVTVIPGTATGKATSHFKVYIPIDPRPFEFTPEQMKSHIKKTKELISDIQSILDRLDKIIKYWKRTCMGTFVALTVKNSFLGGAGKNLARKSVMEFYRDKCSAEVGKKYQTYDECYLDSSNMDEIKRKIEIESSVVKQVNDEFAQYKTVENLKNSDNVCGKYLKTGGSIDDCRDSRRIELLGTKLGTTDEYYVSLANKFNPSKFKARVNYYENAKTYYNNNQGNFIGVKEDDAITAIIDTMDTSGKVDISDIGNVKLQKIDGIVFKNNKIDQPVGLIGTDAGGSVSKSIQLVPVKELGLKVTQAGGISAVEDKIKGDPIAKGRVLLEMANRDATNEDGSMIYANPNDLEDVDVYIHGVTQKIKKPKKDATLYASDVTLQDDRIIATDYALQRHSQTANKGVFAQYDTDGRAVCYPVGNGEYVEVLERYKSGSVQYVQVMNVGANGIIDCGGEGDDKIVLTWDALKYNSQKGMYLDKINSAKRCLKDGEVVGTLGFLGTGKNIVCSMDQAKMAVNKFKPACTDVMDPSDCKLLFNACDPVMCPSSRCTLGGRVQVDNVIQSGIVGSTLLCLPNAKQGVAVPVCLTGVSAGLKNVQSILQGYADCLETSLAGGGDVGVCDYIKSVGICEMVWREAVNIMNIRGGLIDWVSENAFGQPEGGVEYLTFQQSLNNVGESFNYFTTEYSNTFLAAYKGQSTDEIGSQICRLSVRGKLPNVGEIFDQLSEPENPPQYTAFFDTAPYVSEMGDIPFGVAGAGFNTEELTLYKVFYHVYAGTGYPESQSLFGSPEELGGIHKQPLRYAVYLKNDLLGLPPIFVTTNPKSDGRKYVSIEKGKYAQQTVQTVAPTGYNEICIHVTGRDPECGFGKVSSSFAFNELTDLAVENQVKEEITTPEACVTTDKYSSLNVATATLPLPEKYGLFSTGVVRVCNPIVPGPESKWARVGECGGELGSCWLLRDSVSVKDLKISEDIEKTLFERAKEKIDAIELKNAVKALDKLNLRKDQLLLKLRDLVIEYKNKLGEAKAVELIEEVVEEEKIYLPGDAVEKLKRDPMNLAPSDIEKLITDNNLIKEDVEYLTRMLGIEARGLSEGERGGILQVAKNRLQFSEKYGTTYREIVTKTTGSYNWNLANDYKTKINNPNYGLQNLDNINVRKDAISVIKFMLGINNEALGAQRIGCRLQFAHVDNVDPALVEEVKNRPHQLQLEKTIFATNTCK